MKDIQVCGQPVAVAIHGEPSGPPLLLIHGAGHDHGVWDPLARGLASAGHRVIAPDLPAHGASGGQALPSIDAMADWVIALADVLGLDSFRIAGHSMGSLVALAVAARAPDRVHALYLLGSLAPMPVAPFVLDAVRNDPPKGWALINKFSFAPAEMLGEQRRHELEAANLERMQKQGAAVLATDLVACDDWQDGLAAASRVRCPVLLVTGDCDRMTPADAVVPLREAFTACDARLVVLPGLGHALMQEAPRQLVDTMLAAS
ncbi:alpha/beta hydrolase [Thauera sp.]|jgi:pimeloyl-ACP methyl ester carboxylesterase|uniref:alpha/beta fold hydrolase n=1 Tax=Thauera sp. TaxID=1905334 RepID=UPI002A371CDA|nr:alpha/beta hydrolase [Thauera sp.]MDX9885737.1 alpha/beta hydrolase [Thauera sp.]